uniref:outer membrane protein n=1 Tax=Thaumasiovibrio occultus TaxID=1891184 RepID=UPI000B361EC7|nr:porin family protein [Thaumasiovibrio occultus]
MYYWKYVKLLPLALATHTLQAATLPDWLAVSGFASTAAAKSDNETPYYYTRNITDEWCFDCDTIAGLQLDLFPLSWLHASAQLVKRPADDFSDPELEWAYLSFEPLGDIKIRAGRLRSPSFMYSQVVFVNQAYPWARLPAEVYDTTAGFTRFDGVEIIYRTAITDELLLQIQPYASFGYEIEESEINNVLYDVDVDEQYGLRFDIESINWSAYLHYIKARMTITTSEPYIPIFPPGGPYDKPIGFEHLVVPVNAQRWSFGVNYDWRDFTFIAESTTGKNIGWSAYVSAIYHYDNWSPYLIYGKRWGEKYEGDNPNASLYNHGDSITVGLRYDIQPNLSVVGEWQHTYAETNYRGSFTSSNVSDRTDNRANIVTLGLSYSFAL